MDLPPYSINSNPTEHEGNDLEQQVSMRQIPIRIRQELKNVILEKWLSTGLE